MKKLSKSRQITNKVGDIVELTTGEKIKVTFVSESKLYLTGKLYETPKSSVFDTGERQADKISIVKTL